jgi:hypothetical protein
MKRILNTTTIVILSIGAVAIMHSCGEKLAVPENNVLTKLIPTELASARSNALLPQERIIVTICNPNIWETQKQVGATGTIKFVNGPSESQSGFGSLQFSCPDKKFLRLNTNQFLGTKLSDITRLSYSTYVEQSGSISDNIFIVIQTDINDDGTVDFPVVFNPIFQTGSYVEGIGPDQGTTQSNVWQNWNLLDGVWWRGDGPDPWNGGVLFTLATLVEQYPGARITNQGGGPGSIRISGGAPYFSGAFIGYADNFQIGIDGVTKAYDFEERTADAGPDQTVVYGYGSNCATLTGEASGGIPPYTYSWSPGASAPNKAITQVCPTTTTTYTLTVTDANGCTSADGITVFVNDVRCGKNMDKIKICHNGNEICIDTRDVQDHLAHGDLLGNCRAFLK